MVRKSNNAIIEWQEKFYENDDAVTDYEQGHYWHLGVLWNCESLSQKAAQHTRVKASVKDASNLTCLSFREWVNEQLLPNEVLESGFP